MTEVYFAFPSHPAFSPPIAKPTSPNFLLLLLPSKYAEGKGKKIGSSLRGHGREKQTRNEKGNEQDRR